MLSVILYLILTACENEQDIYDEITSDLILSVAETYPNNEITRPTLTLKIETEELYPCINYQIVTQKSVTSDELKIQILGTEIGDLCLTAIGPATTTFELDEGIRKIVLFNNIMEGEHLISISESSVTIDNSISSFSSFTYSSYHRYPENSFAFLCGTLEEDSIVCKEFEQILLNNLSLEEFSFPSIGKKPYPDNSSGYWFNAPAKYYEYKNADDLTKAGELLNTYYSSELSNKEGLGLSIIGWNNTYFRNDQRLDDSN